MPARGGGANIAALTATPLYSPLFRPARAGAVFLGPGDLYRLHNAGTTPARMILTFTPAGIEGFFEETLERALSIDQTPPDNLEEVAARYVAAAPRYGLEFIG